MLRPILIILLLFALIVLAFSTVWTPKLLGRGAGAQIKAEAESSLSLLAEVRLHSSSCNAGGWA
jgi:hypothetical protein